MTTSTSRISGVGRIAYLSVISAGIYLATGFIYADPIASFFVGCMIILTAYPLVIRSGRSLLAAAPESVDVKGVKEDIERITGEGMVHDLHVWSIGLSECLLPHLISCHGEKLTLG